MIDQGKSFRLSEDCVGVVFKDDRGWHGFLNWSIEGSANFVGPFPSEREAVDAVKAEFLLSVRSADLRRLT